MQLEMNEREKEVAEMIVELGKDLNRNGEQLSTSSIQRRLKLGYNRTAEVVQKMSLVGMLDNIEVNENIKALCAKI